jgi:hypothetical protein
MKEQLINIDPVNWLRRPPIPVTATWKVLSGFDKSKPMMVVRYKGPHSLYRVAGWDETRGKMADPYGCWWIDETALRKIYSRIARFEMFEGWIPPDIMTRVKSLPMHYRALTAVCEDWNDFREQVVLKLPHGEEITGLCGAIASQPLRSRMDRKSRKTPWLPGGLNQVYFKRASVTEHNINPLWVHWFKLW